MINWIKSLFNKTPKIRPNVVYEDVENDLRLSYDKDLNHLVVNHDGKTLVIAVFLKQLGNEHSEEHMFTEDYLSKLTTQELHEFKDWCLEKEMYERCKILTDHIDKRINDNKTSNI